MSNQEWKQFTHVLPKKPDSDPAGIAERLAQARNLVDIAGRMVQARELSGLTTAQVARALDIGRTTLWRYERDPGGVPLRLFIALCELYGVDLAWLLTGASLTPARYTGHGKGNGQG